MNDLTPTAVRTATTPPTVHLRERTCAICCATAQHRWMQSRVDFSALDGFAFASRKLPEYMHFALALCNNCDLVFADQVPDSEWFKACYREASFDAVSESRYAAQTYGVELQRILPLLAEKRAALDIGAGDGSFVAELVKAGFDQVIGVEPSIEPVSRALPSVKHLLRNDFFKPEEFHANSFDLITCFQTLEHLEDPLALCKSAHSLLKPGGILLTVAHNFRAPLARLLGERSPIYDIEHLQLFSPPSLASLYKRAGFAEVEVKSLRNTYPLSYWLKLMPIPKTAKRVLLEKLKIHRLGQWLIAAKVGNIIAVGFKRL